MFKQLKKIWIQLKNPIQNYWDPDLLHSRNTQRCKKKQVPSQHVWFFLFNEAFIEVFYIVCRQHVPHTFLPSRHWRVDVGALLSYDEYTLPWISGVGGGGERAAYLRLPHTGGAAPALPAPREVQVLIIFFLQKKLHVNKQKIFLLLFKNCLVF